MEIQITDTQWLFEEALRLLYDSIWYEKGET